MEGVRGGPPFHVRYVDNISRDSATFLLACLAVLGLEGVSLDDL